MATESTLLIVKPDGVRRGLVGEVLRRVEAKGLTIEEMRLFTIPRATAEEHYGEHRDEAVLRRARRLHHERPGGGREGHRRRRDHLLAHADGTDEPRRGRRPGRSEATSPPRSARTSCTAVGLPGVGRARARAVLRGLTADRPTCPGLQEAFDRVGAAARAPPRVLARRRARPSRSPTARRSSASWSAGWPTWRPARRSGPRPGSRSARSRSRSPASSRCRRPRRAASTCTSA